MASIVGDIAIAIGADIAPLVRALGKGEAAVNRFGRLAGLSASGSSAAWTKSGAIIAGAAVAAGLGLVALTKNAMSNIDAMSKSATTLGIHTASLQAMSMVADEAGTSSEDLTKALFKMQNAIAGLGDGTSAQVTAFDKLGISMADLQGIGADEQFAVIAAAINSVQDPAERTAAAIDIFGKSGAELIPMFDGYGAAVKNATDYQRDFNIAIGDDAGKSVEAANDAIGRLGGAFSGLGNTFATEFAPEILATVQFLTESMMGMAMIIRDVKDLLTTTDAETKLAAQAILIDEISASAGKAVQTIDAMKIGWKDSLDDETIRQLDIYTLSIKYATVELESGAMSVDVYKERITLALGEINKLIDGIKGLSDEKLSHAIAQMDGYKDAIFGAAGALARMLGLQDSVAAASVPVGPGGMESDARGRIITPSALAPTVSMFPQQPGVDSFTSPDAIDVGTGGGGGGGNSLADDLEALQERLAGEANAEIAAYENSQMLLEEALAQKLMTTEEFQTSLEALQSDHQNRMAQLDAGAYGDTLQKTSAYFGVLADTFQAGNERMQKIGRVFGAAEALINAWRGFAQVIGNPAIPVFNKFALGAAVLAAGMRAVSAIKSGSSGGGSGGGAASAGSAASGSAQTSTQVSLQLVGGDLYSRDQVLQLINAINSATADGAQILLR